MTVTWTGPALRQLRAIESYLLEHDIAAARRIIGRIERAAARLATMPRLGRPLAERDARLLVVARTRYLLVYRLAGSDVTIVALFHERQQRHTSPFLS